MALVKMLYQLWEYTDFECTLLIIFTIQKIARKEQETYDYVHVDLVYFKS